MNAGARIAVCFCRRHGRRRGVASTVEFAFVGPVLFIVVLGIFEVGRGFMVAHSLRAAARQGCRQAAVSSMTTTAVQNVVDNTLGAWGIHGQTTSVQVNDATRDPATAASGDKITVSVTIPVDSITIVPVPHATGQLSGQYTLRKE